VCGISGAVPLDDLDRSNGLDHVVSKMVASIQHRGPDSFGVVSTKSAVLGSCRLAIQGLEEASNQPLRSADSSCVVVFNGEIYNFIELRDELRQLGHRFISSGDTEVVVHAYEEWGVNCLSRFNGMFAFAVLDQKAGRVFFARDRFGVKPLYYSIVGSLCLIASEPKAIVASGLVRTDLDIDTAYYYLKYAVTDFAERTFFREILQLLPGHYGIIENGEFAVHKWYNLEAVVAQPSPEANEEVLVRSFRELLRDSVTLRMRSDVPVGILLSGGLDSSTIASIAGSNNNGRRLNAFTVTFPSSDVDESKIAKNTASRYGLQWHGEEATRIDEASISDCLRDQFEPVISPSVVAQWSIMRAAHRTGIRVLLSGQGADEYLAGYDYFDSYAVFGWLRHRRYGTALRHLLHERNTRRLIRTLRGAAFLGIPWRVKNRLWRKPWLRPGHSTSELPSYVHDLLRCSSLRDSLLFHVRTRLTELLRYEDRNSMAFSIETRQPFLDFRIVEFVLRLPAELIVSEGVRKRILRLAMRDSLPPEVIGQHRKIGFQTPEEWLRSREFTNSLHSLIETAPPELRRIIDFRRIRTHSSFRRGGIGRNDLWRVHNLLWWCSEVRKWSGATNEAVVPQNGGRLLSAN